MTEKVRDRQQKKCLTYLKTKMKQAGLIKVFKRLPFCWKKVVVEVGGTPRGSISPTLYVSSPFSFTKKI